MKKLLIVGFLSMFLFSGCLFIEDGPHGTVVEVTPPITTVVVDEHVPAPPVEVIVEDNGPVSYTYIDQGSDVVDCEVDPDPEFCD